MSKKKVAKAYAAEKMMIKAVVRIFGVWAPPCKKNILAYTYCYVYYTVCILASQRQLEKKMFHTKSVNESSPFFRELQLFWAVRVIITSGMCSHTYVG